jgi:hypothetical protein
MNKQKLTFISLFKANNGVEDIMSLDCIIPPKLAKNGITMYSIEKASIMLHKIKQTISAVKTESAEFRQFCNNMSEDEKQYQKQQLLDHWAFQYRLVRKELINLSFSSN